MAFSSTVSIDVSMDFSNVGMGAFDESSAQARFQPKARGMDYAQAPIDQHRCFVSGMCYHGDGGHEDKAHRELSYQPNGIGDGGGIKTSPGPLLSARTPTSGGFGELIDPQGGFSSVPANVLPPTPKREKYSTGTSESHSSAVGGQMTFQELTAIRSEPMDYAPEGQSSQESASNCRKRTSQARSAYSEGYFPDETNAPDLLSAGEAPPGYCYQPREPPLETPTSPHLLTRLAQPPPPPPTKQEPTNQKRYQMDASMSRRRNRLMQSQLQQQQQFVSTQRRRSMIRSEMMSPSLAANGRNATMATQALRSRRISTSIYNSNQQQFQPVRKNVTSVSDNQFTQRQYALRSYGNLQSYGTTRSQQLRQPQTWRSPRLAAAAAAAAATTNSTSGQMQNSMINQQDYFYGAASPQGSLTSPTTSPPRTSTGAWGQATRQQQQLAVLNNPRWRHSQSVSTESAEATAAAPPPPPPAGAANEQKLHLSPSLRKANLCTGRNSMGRRMTMASNQAIDNTNLMIKSSLSAPNFDPLLARDSSEAFDFSLSPSAGRRHDEFPDSCSRLRSRKTASRANAYEMESKENGTSMLSSAISAGYLTPEEFMYFNEPFESTWKNVKLTLLQQPELQHRARYLTEGSRGPIKNRNFDGYPTIQLEGWSGPALVQVFVANEASDPHLHMFYQVCLVSTKSNRGCSELVYGFTTVVQAPFTPNSEDRVMSIDSVGLVKLRNSDVERRMASLSEEQQKKLLRATSAPSSSLATGTSTAPTAGQPQRSRQSPVTLQTPSVQTCEDAARRSIKPKSSSARLVYRVLLLSSVNRVEGVLQVISDPIRCTQIVGGPEISRMSIREAHVRSQPELFIIGKNFVRGTRVIFKQLASPSAATVGSPSDVSREDKIDVVWEKEAGIDANFFYQTHLICKVPEYNGPSCPLMTPLQVHVYIQTPTKIGRPEIFTYLPSIPIYGPPTISRLSLREAPSRGMVDLFILGSNFSNDCRVVFRQVVMATDNSHDDTYTPPSVFEETKVVWQREAQMEAGLVNESHLVCRVPPYDGQSLPLLNPLLVQVVIEGSNGTTSPENFYYIQCEG